MPLHGKVVVIKRSGGDGTEFPLTATCLFGRKADCDIRIQLPHVSKEHCRIDLNENKQVILTNLSSSNPTCVNGKPLQQSERLKHGDVITIIDRSFRFEYPPAATPKKRSSVGGKTETFKVLQDQQAVEGAERSSDVFTGSHLKDGASHDNIQRSLDKTLELECAGSQLQSKSNSPFSDLYQMIKKSLDVKTPRTSTTSQIQTPSSKLCTPRPPFTPRRDKAKAAAAAPGRKASGTPQSVKKQGKPSRIPSAAEDGEGVGNVDAPEAASPRRQSGGASQEVNDAEVVEPIPSRSPAGRRKSEDAALAGPAATKEQTENETSPKTKTPQRQSPRNAEKAKKRKSEEIELDSQTQPLKKKRVSFGSHLSPELFDKRLPPDSPLRKGAAPRRSYLIYKPKQSLLRRASVIGLLKEQSPAKTKTPSPKKSFNLKALSPKSPSAKNSPKSRSLSPKPASPGVCASPKNASPRQKSIKTASPKATTPGKKSPKSKSPSPAGGRPSSTRAAETPQENRPIPDLEDGGEISLSPRAVENTASVTEATSEVQTPTVSGRFSVSRINTPSPTAETAQEPPVYVTPKIPVKRKSMKSATRKTPIVSKSAVKLLLRRSGISMASMKMRVPWTDIVKFGKPKAQVVAPPKKKTIKKPTKRAVVKAQTPARKVLGHVSTGHAVSPATIVVGRAHKRTAVHPTGAAPRFVTNAAICKNNMKMDEDLTGLSEMFKTPARARKSFKSASSVIRTPASNLGTSTVDQSVLHTPEEPGEMIVSPLSVASTVKSQIYSSEAVQRLLDQGEEASFVSETQQQWSVETPKQKPERLIGVKKLMKTPKQKPERHECLTGVKRIMKTPKQKAEPVEDLRGKILKTPKEKREVQECLTGVKRIMKTPRQKTQPVDDIRGKLLVTPKQKPEQRECLTGVKRIFKTPKQKAEPIEDLRGKLLKTPKSKKVHEMSLDGVKELLQTPKHDGQSETTETTKVSTETEEKSAEDFKKTFPTQKQKAKPVEEHFGLRRLMKSPREKSEPMEDFEGLKELMEEEPSVCLLAAEANEGNEDVAPVKKQEEKMLDEIPPEVEGQTEARAKALVVPAPARGRKGKKHAGKEPTRGRRAKSPESDRTAAEADKITATANVEPSKPLRGRKTKPPAKVTRGRKAEEEVKENATESQEPDKKTRKPETDDVERAEEVKPAEIITTEKLEVTAAAAAEPEEVLEETAKPKRRGRKAKPDNEKSAEATDLSAPTEKPKRGRRGKPVTDEAEQEKEPEPKLSEAKEGKSLPAAAKRTRRGAAAPTEESNEESTAMPSEPVPPKRPRRAAAKPTADEVPATGDPEKSPLNDDDKPGKSVSWNSDVQVFEIPKDTPVKSARGRKAKTPNPQDAETKTTAKEAGKAEEEDLSEIVVEAQRAKRGRNLRASLREENQTPATSRGKGGRKTKQEVKENATESQEPDKKTRKTRKPKTGDVERDEEVKPAEIITTEKLEVTAAAEPEEVLEETAKPKRRGRKAKPDNEKSAEANDLSAPTEKPKRGRRGKPVTDEADEAEQEKEPEPKLSEAKEGKSLPAAAKRTRRGAAAPTEESNEESTAMPSEPVPPKRPRRAAAKPTADEVPATGDPEKSLLNDDDKCVRIKSNHQVVDIPKATSVKSTRGRKAKTPNPQDAETKTTAKEAGKAEEEDLSEIVVEAQPAKRGRRGAKVAVVTTESTTKQGPEEAETQGRNRRGRSAKK